ncbi:MAG: hypothetical protein ACREP4_02715 [Stenotrophomonas sp.]|uniref:hypothetical protein n=1 Tax=Stenotrophomonas sp. TaxID=69392 RepID=UPI003D6D18D1
MQSNALPRRTLYLLAIALLALISVGLLSPAPPGFILGVVVALGAIVLMGVGLIPQVRDALKRRLDTPRGEIVCIVVTVIFLFATVTCVTVWWVLASRNAEMQRAVMTRNHMAVLLSAASAMALTGPIAWRWLASRLLSQPVSSLRFFRATSGAMRLLIVLSLVFLLLTSRLYQAIQPWTERPFLQWLEGVLTVVHWSLAAVVVFAFLSGVSQLLQRCFGPRQDPRSPH